MAQFFAETLEEAAHIRVQATIWERDQEAWNLPRAPGGTIDRGADTDEVDASESDRGEQRAVPPAAAPRTTE